jgi:hypothetical protein
MIRDRDNIYGADCVRKVRAMHIEQVITAPRSPWQKPYCERVIGTISRDCLDHVIVLGEQHLRRILREYLEYYHGSRTHLSLDEDAPEPRAREPINDGNVITIPMVSGLHHRYTRRGLTTRLCRVWRCVRRRSAPWARPASCQRQQAVLVRCVATGRRPPIPPQMRF